MHTHALTPTYTYTHARVDLMGPDLVHVGWTHTYSTTYLHPNSTHIHKHTHTLQPIYVPQSEGFTTVISNSWWQIGTGDLVGDQRCESVHVWGYVGVVWVANGDSTNYPARACTAGVKQCSWLSRADTLRWVASSGFVADDNGFGLEVEMP